MSTLFILKELIWAPFLAWVLMITAGALHPLWGLIPSLGYPASVVITAALAILSAWHPKQGPALVNIACGAVTTFPTMLLLGWLHTVWSWVPALGYWQVVLAWVLITFGVFIATIITVTAVTYLVDSGVLRRVRRDSPVKT